MPVSESYSLPSGVAEIGARVVVHDAGINQDGTGFDPNVAADAASRIREAGQIK